MEGANANSATAAEGIEALEALEQELTAAVARDIADIAFSFIERRQESVTKLCKYIIRGTNFPLDEAESECVVRAMNAASTFDATKGASFDTHCLGTLREYLIKLIRTRTPQREQWRRERLQDRATNDYKGYTTPQDYEALDDTEQLKKVWDNLSADDAMILELRYIYEMSLEEIAAMEDCSTSHVHKRIQKALNAARGKMNGHYCAAAVQR